MDEILDVFKNTLPDQRKTEPYDTQAQVLRVEDGTAWVHIPGGVDETPVKLTIAAKPGDTVQVRVGGGRAHLTGNETAPPTDDTIAVAAQTEAKAAGGTAKEAQAEADKAARIAGNTNQYFWHTETGTDTGAHITEVDQATFLSDPANGGGNLLARSNGIAVRDGLTELATFSASGVQIGVGSGAHSVVDADGQRFYASDGTTQLANIGYGEGAAESGTAVAPYYTFGTRATGSTVGNYSFGAGYNVTASGFASHAEGRWTTASGSHAHAEGNGAVASGAESHAAGNHTTASEYASHASGFYTSATKMAQTVIGTSNIPDTSSTTTHPDPPFAEQGIHSPGKYALIIGNGHSNQTSDQSNALTVTWDGEVELYLGTSQTDTDLSAAITAAGWATEVIS